MFKVAEIPKFTVTVNVDLAGEKGVVRQSFDAVFRRPSQRDLDRINEQLSAGEIDDATLINEWLVDWRGVADEGGEIPFTPEQRDRVMDIYPVRPTTVRAFFTGLAAGKGKN